MYFYLKNLFILSALSFLISACTPLLDYKSTQYSYTEERELNELKKAHTAFDSMQSVDVALHLNKRDLSSLVNKSFDNFSKNFSELHAGEFSHVTFARLEFHLSAQQAFSDLDFSFEVDALKRKIYGHIKAKHVFTAGRDEFIMRTTFDEIIIERVENDEAFDQNSENRHLIASSVKSFMNALNTEMLNVPLKIPVDMNILKGINGKDVVSSSDYKLHTARPINMLTKMQVYMPFIYDEGVVFLGASELNKSGENTTLKPESTHLWTELNEKINLALDENMGVTLDTLQKKTSCYVSKFYLSKQMNLALKNIDLRTIKKSFLKIGKKDNRLLKEVVLFDKKRLPSCEKSKTDCSERLKPCKRECDINYGVHKCDDCSTLNPFEKVRCVNRQEACKTREELSLYECKRNENSCKHDNDLLRSECESENRSLVLQCSEKKDKLVFVDNAMTLAKLEMSFDTVNSYAVQRIHSIVFNQTLENLEVLRDVHVSVDSRLNFEITNTPNTDVNCTLEMIEPLFTPAYSDYIGDKRKLVLFTETLHNGYMMIKAKSEPHSMQIQLMDTPYENLISHNKFALSCAYQNIPMPLISQEVLLEKKDIPSKLAAVLGRLELKFEVEELSFLISPIRLSSDTVLYPSMETKAIGFTKEVRSH